jgi:hypothetical protein
MHVVSDFIHLSNAAYYKHSTNAFLGSLIACHMLAVNEVRSAQVLSTRSLGLLNFASEVGLSQHTV